MQRDILSNLKIKCSNCDFVYKYEEKLVVKEVTEEKREKVKEYYGMRLRNCVKMIEVLVGEAKVVEEEVEGRERVEGVRRKVRGMFKEKYNMVQRALRKIN